VKLRLSIAGLFLFAAAATGFAAGQSTNAVAVLDFATESASTAGDDWTVGLADFVELALQKEGVPTLERRQIRLLLGERNLDTHGRLAAGTLQAAKLPAVACFVSGTVRRTAGEDFEVTLSLIQADTALVKASWTRRGNYSKDWLAAIASLAGSIRTELQAPAPLPTTRSEAESLTWLPEAALPFFKGMEFYSRGDFAQSIAWFRKASGKAGQFDQARLWEARASRQAGLPVLADFAVPALDRPAFAATNHSAAPLPVVAVIAADDVAAASRAAFVREIEHSGRYRVFDPGLISATAREIDLQLTGQMAAPLNGHSVWLVIDSVIVLDGSAGRLHARQRNLLSGETTGRADGIGGRGDEAYAALARQHLKSKPAASPSVSEPAAADLSEPDAHDTPESAFAKIVRHVTIHPEEARYWVALADAYGDWNSKMWILQQAVSAVERNPNQPEAAYWLASALWRKRQMTRWAWIYSHAADYTELPLANDFAQLLAWFPKSPEATTALAETARKSGIYIYSEPKDRRFLRAPFDNIGPARKLAETTPERAKSFTEVQRLARLRDLRQHRETARAWLLADALRESRDQAIRTEAQSTYNELFKRLVEQDQQFKEFKTACDQNQTDTAMKLGWPLLNCIQRKTRLAVIDRCGAILKQKGDADVWYRFVAGQAERYSRDFDFDALTELPVTVTLDYTLEDHSTRAERWTTSGPDLEYARLMGELAEGLQACRRPELAAKVFEAINRNAALPVQNRLTAACDLASAQYQQGKAFEALDTLKELLQQTEGTATPVARKTTWNNSQVEDTAFGLLRKIRLYCDDEIDFTRCCGEPVPVPALDPETAKQMNEFFDALWQSFQGGVGGDNQTIRQKLLAKKDQVMPALLYKLWRGEDAKRILIFCGELGTNAAAAIPYLPRYICYSDDFPENNNALSAFCGLGHTAACARPLLILAAEGTTSTFNAEAALRDVGPAPKQVMPYLAKLLYHKNPGVRKRAAQAILETTGLQNDSAAGKSEDERIAVLQHWWETDGMKNNWQATLKD